MACGQVRHKRELVRLVSIPGGSVEADATGKKAGRGAYLCRQEECWKAGLKGNRIERALGLTLTPDNREQLIEYGKLLLKESISGEGTR